MQVDNKTSRCNDKQNENSLSRIGELENSLGEREDSLAGSLWLEECSAKVTLINDVLYNEMFSK